MWLKNQRNSRHGVDYAFNLKDFDLQEYHRRYCETLLAVDESLGRIFQHLERRGTLDSTLIIYMGDNGYQFGEHGLIDKRTAYEASMRIPLLAQWPGGLPANRGTELLVENGGRLQGRFLMRPDPAARPTHEQLLVAVALADQVGAALASTHVAAR